MAWGWDRWALQHGGFGSLWLLRTPSAPGRLRLATGQHSHLLSSLSVHGGRLSALRRRCLTSLGLLLLLRAEVFTVARLSFVSYTFHRFFSLWQIISTQLILNFPLFAPAVELLA